MKKIFLALALVLTACSTWALNSNKPFDKTRIRFDTLRLQIDSDRNVFYQKTVKVDTTLTIDIIYGRLIQFMAAKNMQQTYGYEQEGRLIYTTSQDLNVNPVYVGDENDGVEPYTAQFSIIFDIKHGRYRYTINNVVFFHPVAGFNKRETLLDVEIKATNTDTKRIARSYRNFLLSFERYLNTFTDEIHAGVVQKSIMYRSKF